MSSIASFLAHGMWHRSLAMSSLQGNGLVLQSFDLSADEAGLTASLAEAACSLCVLSQARGTPLFAARVFYDTFRSPSSQPVPKSRFLEFVVPVTLRLPLQARAPPALS